MKPITLIFITVAVTSCMSSKGLDFKEMTQREVDSYNLTVASEDRVYCAEVQPNPARRRTKYVCVTAKDIERELGDAAYRQDRRDEQPPAYNPQPILRGN